MVFSLAKEGLAFAGSWYQLLLAALVGAGLGFAVFRMRNEALTFQVIADRQQCPVNTAVKRMRYAVGKLRKLLGEENGA